MSAPPVGFFRGSLAASNGAAVRDRDAESAGRAWRLALERALQADGSVAERNRTHEGLSADAEHQGEGTSETHEPIGRKHSSRGAPGDAAMIDSRSSVAHHRGTTTHLALRTTSPFSRSPESGFEPLVSTLQGGLQALFRAFPLSPAAHVSAPPSLPGPCTSPPAVGATAPPSTGIARPLDLGGASAFDVAEVASRPDFGTAERSSEPIRWHAEWSEDGLRIWLGLDLGRAGSLANIVEPLVAEARRRAEGRGTRLLSFVCNGLAVFEIEAPSTPHVPPEEIP